MAIKVSTICTAIATTLGGATGVKSWTPYDEISGGIDSTDCPRLEVSPGRGTTDPSGDTDRTTFSAKVQQSVITFFADLYASPRSQLPDDIKLTVDLIDALSDVLEAQERPPFFGMASRGVQAFAWDWRRVTFIRSKKLFMGARFTISCRIF